MSIYLFIIKDDNETITITKVNINNAINYYK